jgi:hypothetical protein
VQDCPLNFQHADKAQRAEIFFANREDTIAELLDLMEAAHLIQSGCLHAQGARAFAPEVPWSAGKRIHGTKFPQFAKHRQQVWL